ncbi:glycine zipper 2TM domain-containing protein [Piscinibacter sp.]|uniref:glycine zipper 2TM domain-containing protein n=1 Tax=Piscinibacter sp. TaxID=1903157 RepID=UPI0039E5FDBD
MSTNIDPSPGAVAPNGGTPSRTVWLIAGILGAASLAAGAGMLVNKGLPAPVAQAVPANEAPAQPAKPVPKLAAAAPATVCQDCGVVESVQAVTRKGQASGAGAVAGGVLGAVVGNQVGKGNGRKAMTVLGAVGGGVAGHEIEKRAKSTTVHVVKVRMDDGSLRSVEQAAAARIGERVVVEGGRLRALPASQQG